MSEISGALRDVVIERAENCCEYCQLPAQLQVGGFEIDHIVPRSREGERLKPVRTDECITSVVGTRGKRVDSVSTMKHCETRARVGRREMP